MLSFLHSQIRHRGRKNSEKKTLYRKCTLQGLLNELDVTECFKQPGKDIFVCEVLNKQKQIYLDMEVPEPSNITSICIDSGMQDIKDFV